MKVYLLLSGLFFISFLAYLLFLKVHSLYLKILLIVNVVLIFLCYLSVQEYNLQPRFIKVSLIQEALNPIKPDTIKTYYFDISKHYNDTVFINIQVPYAIIKLDKR